MSQVNFKYMLSLCLAAAMMHGCGDSGTNPDDGPAFSDMAIPGNKLYVAYKSPDPIVKLDTVKISFRYNFSKVKSIDVRATLDSEKTWIPLAGLTPNSSNKASVLWIPEDDSVISNFFGKREGFIRVRDTLSNEHVDSDSFIMVGKVPFILIGPNRKQAFPITDTVKIMYGQNRDRSGELTAGFLLASDTTYVDISRKSATYVVSESLPIKEYITKFAPLDFAERAGNFPEPITLFIADYGASSFALKADSIIITQ
jgi:hypothetical protein